MQKNVKEIKGDKDGAKSVVLNDGTEIQADLVLIGVGIEPKTDILKNTSVQLDKQGGVVCDPFL
jgi:3-phenylpropionate/trans-cinnamate dioxygenase ferredoxin reductase subunit